MLPLKLERPLAVLDLETTGLNPRLDRIVEIAILKLMPNGERKDYAFLVNPGIPIPPTVIAIHGITDEDVADAPTFLELAPKINQILDGCDLAGFGIERYDAQMLREEFARSGIKFEEKGRRVIDAQQIFHKKEPRNLTAALAFYCNEEHTGAHRAKDDCEATLKVLAAQLEYYPDLPRDLDELDSFSSRRQGDWVDQTGKLRWLNGEVAINFGTKHFGKSLRLLLEKDNSFAHWILKSDFPHDTKEIVSQAMEGVWPDLPEKFAAK